jgi:CRP-like cAMP-binding protein
MMTPKPHTSILDALARHALLRHFAAEDVRALVAQAAVHMFAERQALFEQGESGRTVLVVIQGYVKLSATMPSGREVVFDVVGPNDLFGELAVLTDQPRAATATALSPGSLLAIEGRSFRAALARAPEAMFWIIRLLGRRLNRATEQMTDGLDLPAPGRVAKALLHLAALHSRPVAEGLEISLSLSQRELGGMTGLIRESINKHLGLWRDSGWLSLTGRTITLHDVAALRALLREFEAG